MGGRDNQDYRIKKKNRRERFLPVLKTTKSPSRCLCGLRKACGSAHENQNPPIGGISGITGALRALFRLPLAAPFLAAFFRPPFLALPAFFARFRAFFAPPRAFLRPPARRALAEVLRARRADGRLARVVRFRARADERFRRAALLRFFPRDFVARDLPAFFLLAAAFRERFTFRAMFSFSYFQTRLGF